MTATTQHEHQDCSNSLTYTILTVSFTYKKKRTTTAAPSNRCITHVAGNEFLDLVSAIKSIAYSCPKLKTCPAVYSYNASTMTSHSNTGYESGAFLKAKTHGNSLSLRDAVRDSLHTVSHRRRLQLQQLFGSLRSFGSPENAITRVADTLCKDITPKICDIDTHSLKPTTTAVLKIILDTLNRPAQDLPALEQLMYVYTPCSIQVSVASTVQRT